MKKKYIDLTKFEKPGYPYSIVIGGRASGKSYWVKRFCVDRAFRDPEHKFVYLRRYQIESKPADIEGYFRDCPVSDITHGQYTKIVVYRGSIFLASVDPETGKTVRGAVIGYVIHLSNEVHFKSQNYNDVQEIIFEEFIVSNGAYLWREPEALQSLISTVARRRKIRVWMIGNTVSRICPYFKEYGIERKLLEMKPGTIAVCEHETDQINEDGQPVKVRIGVYYTEQPDDAQQMFFGKIAKMTTGGDWQTRSYPHLPYHYRDCRKQYNVLLKHNSFLFNMEIVKSPKSEYMIFIHPHTGKTEDQRIIDTDPNPSPLVTKKLDPRRRGDRLLKYLYDTGTVFYSDNLTGADFEGVMKEVGSL